MSVLRVAWHTLEDGGGRFALVCVSYDVELREALAAIAGGARFDLIGRDVDRFTGDFNPGECMPFEQFVNAKDFDQTGRELDKEVYVGIDLPADTDGVQIVK